MATSCHLPCGESVGADRRGQRAPSIRTASIRSGVSLLQVPRLRSQVRTTQDEELAVATGLPSQEQVIELLDNEFARAGYEIENVVVDTKAQPPRITVIADGDNPLDLDTIALLSRRASALLDDPDGAAANATSYVLEVSSPGVHRPLTTEKHFRRARGRKAELTLLDGSAITGRLGDTDNGMLRVVVRSNSRGWTVRDVALDDIVKAVVQVEFSSPNPHELELGRLGSGEAGP
jgi:ribosome maturation factor RimP